MSGDHGGSRNTLWLVIGLIMALFAAETNIERMVRMSQGALDSGQVADAMPAARIGLPEGMAVSTSPAFAPGFGVVHDLSPDSVLAKAGVVDGDHVRFDFAPDQIRELHVGDPISAVVDHNGARRHIDMVAAPFAQRLGVRDIIGEVLLSTILLCSVLTGVFILLRSRRHLTGMLLGMAFIAFGSRGSTAGFWGIGAADYLPVTFIYTTILRAMPALFLAFAIRFYRETAGTQPGWMTPLFWTYTVPAMVIGYAFSAGFLFSIQYAVIGDAAGLYTAIFFLGLFLTAGILTLGLRRADATTRRRYVLMLAAIVMVILGRGLDWILQLFGDNTHHLFLLNLDSPVDIAKAAFALAGPLLFAYAVLRHKVLDLGFAINRTLVYGVVSVILLLAFGLVEWASEKFIPIESREKNLVIDAAIALGIFLTFHRLRDFAEKVVERLFFHAWHQKEKKLKDFVAEAAFVTRPEALDKALLHALSQFADGAQAALYALGEDGDYHRKAGKVDGLAAGLDANNPALVRLRAQHQPVEPDHNPDAGGLPAALLLPMTHGQGVTGFAALGSKPTGETYRPDEKEALAHAAHQVGLALHVLRVERLEAANRELELKYGELKAALAGGAK